MSNLTLKETHTVVSRHYEATWENKKGGEVKGSVFIHFDNGKFKSATYPFSGTYTKAQWKVLGLIAREIDRFYPSDDMDEMPF